MAEWEKKNPAQTMIIAKYAPNSGLIFDRTIILGWETNAKKHIIHLTPK